MAKDIQELDDDFDDSTSELPLDEEDEDADLENSELEELDY